MCGISGIFGYNPKAQAVQETELQAITEHMSARGPDGIGYWCSNDGRIALGHRRLAIIDPETGQQPMRHSTGQSVTTFNGAIYNYRELRVDLENLGHRFQTRSDTEVLLAAHEEWGLNMFGKLRGMYAFALWDEEQKRLLIARDPFGIKPLYFADDGQSFRFASQVKALLAGGAIDDTIEPAGEVGFLLLGSVPEPFTLYQAIRALPAGFYMYVDGDGIHSPVEHTSIARIVGERRENGEIAGALRDSVRAHLVADVPVGCFLSAGIDSGLIAALASELSDAPLKTVTIAFREFHGMSDDESPLAQELAARHGCDHVTRTVTREEFDSDLPLIMNAMDQPSIDGVNTWFASKAAAECGLKVVLSGLGGDELFGGYPSFRRIPNWVRWLRLPSMVPGLGTLVRAAMVPLAKGVGLHPKAAGMLEYGGRYDGAYLLTRGLFMPWELEDHLDSEAWTDGLRRLELETRFHETGFRSLEDSAERISVLESRLYMKNQLLRDTDWAAMAHSLEVRLPLVDCQILSMAVPRLGKAVLRDAANLPPNSPTRMKSGFSTALQSWMHTGKGPWSREWARLVLGFFQEQQSGPLISAG